MISVGKLDVNGNILFQVEDLSRRGRCGRYQKFIWDVMEKPESSLGAQETLDAKS